MLTTNMQVYVLSLLVCIFFKECLSANILAVATLASPSHFIWHKRYLLSLVGKGHNVTLLAHDEPMKNIPNFTMITLEGIYDKIHEEYNTEDFAYDTPLQSIFILYDWTEALCKYDLETNGMKTLLNYPKDYKFDLIIWDISCGRCLYPLIDKFGTPPVIGTSPFGLHSHLAFAFGSNAATYVPYFQASLTDRMTITESLRNFFYTNLLNLAYKYMCLPREHMVSRKYFGDDVSSVDDYQRNISLLLVNTDPVLSYPQCLPPNIISVGGIHIEPVKKLPDDLKAILDEAQHGVVYVSFGSNLNFTNFGKRQQHAFLDTFRELTQTVLMKHEGTGVKFPRNVITREWLPQNDVLAHPNVKLFVTHGGLLSSQQAVYHGVPVIVMPFYLDQHGNAKTFDAKKLGKSLNYFEVTYDIVHDAVREVLDNPEYVKNMQTASWKFRERQCSPLETAVFWTEYLLKHGSAEHLSPASRDMSIFQRLDLDIALIIFVVFMIFLTSCYILIRRIFGALLPDKNNNGSKLKVQ